MPKLRLVLDLHRATHAVGIMLEALPSLGVSQAEAHVLAFLHENGNSTVGQIHQAFGHKRSTLTSIIDRLVARGVVSREPDSEDRRSIVVRLNAKGRPLAKRVHVALVKFEDDVLRYAQEADLTGFGWITSLISKYSPDGRKKIASRATPSVKKARAPAT